MIPGSFQSEREDDILELYSKIRKVPFEFLKTCVFTKDQVDKINPIKRFPYERKYLELFSEIWEKYPLVAIPKSRRMTMSWTCLSLYLWDTMFKKGRLNAFVSKKEDDADELVERAYFIYRQIKEKKLLPPDLLPRVQRKFCSLKFPDIDSEIVGCPQGADQLRQFTFSGIMADEMAFWDKAEEMYSASAPTIDGGGRFTGISSPGPGFFKRVVFDQFEVSTNTEVDTSKFRKIFPMQGVEIWKNPKNKFCVFQIHYTADPDKRSAKFKESIKSKMPEKKFLQEYELHWDSYEGLPVYSDYDRNIHGSKTEIQPEIGLPLLRGWDFGMHPACVVAQVQGDQLVVLWEKVMVNRGIDKFSEAVLNECAVLFPEWDDLKNDWRDFIDPAGHARAATDATTCSQILSKAGIRPIPGEVSFEARRSSVEHFLVKNSKEGPGFLIDMGKCPILCRGFEGGYRYSDKAADIEPTKVMPLKDEHSHPHDALQYICSKIVYNRKKKSGKRIPKPRYSWSNKDEVSLPHIGDLGWN